MVALWYVSNSAGVLSSAGTSRGDRAKAESKDVLCLLLLASRDIENEELLLNYRLSPGAERPDWYSPVDSVEDKRRWA